MLERELLKEVMAPSLIRLFDQSMVLNAQLLFLAIAFPISSKVEEGGQSTLERTSSSNLLFVPNISERTMITKNKQVQRVNEVH